MDGVTVHQADSTKERGSLLGQDASRDYMLFRETSNCTGAETSDAANNVSQSSSNNTPTKRPRGSVTEKGQSTTTYLFFALLATCVVALPLAARFYWTSGDTDLKIQALSKLVESNLTNIVNANKKSGISLLKESMSAKIGELSDQLKSLTESLGQLRSRSVKKEDQQKNIDQLQGVLRYEIQSLEDKIKNSTLTVVPDDRRPVVDLTLHLVCHDAYWKHLPQLLESVSLQTYIPSDLVLVLSMPESADPKRGREFDYQLLKLLSPHTHTKVFFRSGKLSQGSNRQFASEQSATDILSFFDCDDWMHPQRTEMLYKLFTNHPEVDIALHEFHSTPIEDFLDVTSSASKHKFSELYPQEVVDSIRPAFDYEEVRLRLPKAPNGKEWDINDKTTEPNWDHGYFMWFFAYGMDLKWLDGSKVGMAHNGWVTTRRRVFDRVQFPDIFQGEDSLFNWRAIRAGFNFTAIIHKLGAYLGYKRHR